MNAEESLADELNTFYARFEAAANDANATANANSCRQEEDANTGSVFIISEHDSASPMCFKESIIVPVPKKPHPVSLYDYHPVAMTSAEHLVIGRRDGLPHGYIVVYLKPSIEVIQRSWEGGVTVMYLAQAVFNAIFSPALKAESLEFRETEYKCWANRRNYHNSYDTELSDPVKITVRERPRAVLNVSLQSWLTEGDSVTLSCEVTDSSTDWTFSWYTVVPYRDGLTGINNNGGYSVYVELLSDSSRGSGGKYTLSPAALNHTGVYMCRGERGEPALHSQYSNPQPLWITGESPPVSLIINPSRIQHFTNDSLSLSCEDQSNSTGWTVRRYTHSERVLDCSHWGSVTGSTCNISFLSTSYTGVYWCESESGENSNPVHITVHDGDVILESPVHPVTEGHPLTLRCLYRNPNPSNVRADFYKDGSVLQNQSTGEMIIQTVSKSDEGFYHCKHPERGESPQSWISVRCEKTVSGSSGLTVGLVVGLGFLFIAILILMILLWFCKRKKEKQQKTNQTSDQNQIRSGAEDSQSGHTPLQAGQTLSQ
ncbi:Fc receptor-like protein 5 [Hemibagrus wyckioides]|uniref:Fc receptor-like protein 5 n=1 Tax=Hemibagrus wyckioides TaxID=337641 RepID=UPI00266C6EF3|nr:Fc receptor-like protein 5 [Hemibagrus wyckioides]